MTDDELDEFERLLARGREALTKAPEKHTRTLPGWLCEQQINAYELRHRVLHQDENMGEFRMWLYWQRARACGLTRDSRTTQQRHNLKRLVDYASGRRVGGSWVVDVMPMWVAAL